MPGEKGQPISIRERRRGAIPWPVQEQEQQRQHASLSAFLLGEGEDEAVFLFPLQSKIDDLVISPISFVPGTLMVFLVSEGHPTQSLSFEILGDEAIAADAFMVHEKTKMFLRFRTEEEEGTFTGLISFSYRFK